MTLASGLILLVWKTSLKTRCENKCDRELWFFSQQGFLIVSSDCHSFLSTKPKMWVQR